MDKKEELKSLLKSLTDGECKELMSDPEILNLLHLLKEKRNLSV